MASARDPVLSQFRLGLGLIEKFTADLSDAEYYQPAIEGTNHAAWILGHLATTEDWAASALTGKAQRLPKETHELFNGRSTCIADASKYPGRKAMDEMFRDARNVAIESLIGFDEGRWNEPSPEGFPDDFFPTVGAVWAMQGGHQFWHIGQLTVCRHAIKKPRVLGL